MLPLLLLPALQSPPPAQPLSSLNFLLGAWEGEGRGGPGQGGGGFTFGPELQGKVLVRRSHAEYPATKDRPASSHEDLMVAFSEGGKLRADYFDNEGHMIRYDISGPDERGSVRFISDAKTQGPRFRLTYTPTGKDTLSLRFEIAPPGNPEAFATYIEATARRKK